MDSGLAEHTNPGAKRTELDLVPSRICRTRLSPLLPVPRLIRRRRASFGGKAILAPPPSGLLFPVGLVAGLGTSLGHEQRYLTPSGQTRATPALPALGDFCWGRHHWSHHWSQHWSPLLLVALAV